MEQKTKSPEELETRDPGVVFGYISMPVISDTVSFVKSELKRRNCEDIDMDIIGNGDDTRAKISFKYTSCVSRENFKEASRWAMDYLYNGILIKIARSLKMMYGLIVDDYSMGSGKVYVRIKERGW